MDADDIVLALMETPQPEDPYPLYHRLREIAPNHPSIMGMRFLARYDDCVELLRSPSFHMAVAEIMAAADKTTVEFHAYLRGLCRDRRARPRDDLLTAMVQAEDEARGPGSVPPTTAAGAAKGSRLSDEELVSFAVTLLGAGTETT